MTGFSIEEITRLVREFHNPSQNNHPSMPLLELDESEMEVFWAYWPELKEIGVDASSELLQESLNGNPRNIEDAILRLFEYRANNLDKFTDPFYATNCLAKALREGWKPLKKVNL